MTPQDGLLLIQDGVYALTDQRLYTQLAGIAKLYALNEDMQARGLGDGKHNVEIIDYKAFVSLTLAFERTLSW
jgi:sulfur relay protein TusB/DsrH